VIITEKRTTYEMTVSCDQCKTTIARGTVQEGSALPGTWITLRDPVIYELERWTEPNDRTFQFCTSWCGREWLQSLDLWGLS
jgi:hypothetical protein